MAYKEQINFCVSLRKKMYEEQPYKLTQRGLTTNKSFWKSTKPFLTNKGFIGNNEITLIHKNKIISNEKQLAKLFNRYYINSAERAVALDQNSLAKILKTPAERLLEILSILAKIIQALYKLNK